MPVYPGIGASAPGLSLDQVIDQIEAARTRGAPGFVIFNYDGDVAARQIPALGWSLTAPPRDR